MADNLSISCGILTISDKGSIGKRQDTSGPNLRDKLSALNYKVSLYEIVPDNQEIISETLQRWSDQKHIDLIITTGGTGVSPTDMTPEATRSVINKEIPGIGEAMRMESFKITPHALLSRGTAGIRGRTLIINLPGSKKAAWENLEAVLASLPHAVSKIKGSTEDCGS